MSVENCLILFEALSTASGQRTFTTTLEAQAFRKLHGKKDRLSFLRNGEPMLLLDRMSEGIFGHMMP